MKKFIILTSAVAMLFMAPMAAEAVSSPSQGVAMSSSQGSTVTRDACTFKGHIRMNVQDTNCENLYLAVAKVTVPTGVYFNGTNFVKIEKDWLRIVINQQMAEYSFNAQRDPWNNYVLTFNNGESITINSDGRSLYYNGEKYSKR